MIIIISVSRLSKRKNPKQLVSSAETAARSVGGQTLSALGVMGEPEGGLLPWPSLPESRLSGGFSVAPLLPSVGQPPPPLSLAEAQTRNSRSRGRKTTTRTTHAKDSETRSYECDTRGRRFTGGPESVSAFRS